MKILVEAILVVMLFVFGVARAQLDPNDVVLALNFDEGQGETAKDSSDKGMMGNWSVLNGWIMESSEARWSLMEATISLKCGMMIV